MPKEPKHNPRTKPPELRREDLMNAAQRLFLAQGVAATAIEQITSSAGVAKGTFYLYFSSKEDVLAALGDRFAQQLLVSIKEAVAQIAATDFRQQLGTWARACVRGYLASIRLHNIVFYGSQSSSREDLTGNIIVDHLCGLLQRGVEAGAWSIDNPRVTAVFLYSGLHGVVDDAYTQEKQINQKRVADRLERLCYRAVGLPSR